MKNKTKQNNLNKYYGIKEGYNFINKTWKAKRIKNHLATLDHYGCYILKDTNYSLKGRGMISDDLKRSPTSTLTGKFKLKQYDDLLPTPHW